MSNELGWRNFLGKCLATEKNNRMTIANFQLNDQRNIKISRLQQFSNLSIKNGAAFLDLTFVMVLDDFLKSYPCEQLTTNCCQDSKFLCCGHVAFFLRRPQHPSNSADVTTMATLTVFFNNFQKMPDDSMPDFANATISN